MEDTNIEEDIDLDEYINAQELENSRTPSEPSRKPSVSSRKLSPRSQPAEIVKHENNIQVLEVIQNKNVEDEFDEEELFAGMKKLSEFSSVLSNAMGSLAKSVKRMDVKFKISTDTVESMKHDIDSHGKSLKYLREMSDSHRVEIQGALDSANRVEQNMSLQVLEVSGTVEKAMSVQSEKVSEVKRSLTETVQSVRQISRIQSAKSKTSSLKPKVSVDEIEDSNTEHVLKDVLSRLADLEATSSNQSEVNNILSMAITNTVEELTKEQADNNRQLKKSISELEGNMSDVKTLEKSLKGLIGAHKRQDSRLDAMQLELSQLKDKVAAIPLKRPRTKSPKRRINAPVPTPAVEPIAIAPSAPKDPSPRVPSVPRRIPSPVPTSDRVPSTVPVEQPQPIPEPVVMEEVAPVVQEVMLDTFPLKEPEVVADFPNNVVTVAEVETADPKVVDVLEVPAEEAELSPLPTSDPPDCVSRLGEGSTCTEDTVVSLLQRVEDLEHLTSDLEGRLENSTSLAKDALFSIRTLTNNVHELENQLDMMAMRDNNHSHAIDEHPSTSTQRHHPLRNRSMAALAGDPNGHLGTMIDKVKRQWVQVYEDLSFGIDLQLQQQSASHYHGENVFHHKLVEYRSLLQTSLSAIENIVISHAPTVGNSKTNNHDCLVGIHPFIDTLVFEAEHLLTMDSDAKFAAVSHKQYVSSSTVNQLQHQTTFDDYLCADRSANMVPHLKDVCKSSIPLLDELIDKTHLRRRVHQLEKDLIDKASQKGVNLLEKDLRIRINTKLDSQDYVSSLNKKASLGELQQFRETIFKQMDELKNQSKELAGGVSPVGKLVGGMRSMRGFLSGVNGGGGGGNGGAGDNHDDAIALLEEERDALLHRFDLLFRQFQDLAAQCETYVPREEVEKALHAVLMQVKTLKLNSIDHTVLQTKMNDKADVEDMKRLIAALEQSVGEIAGNSASAIHLRCLMCDKPVNSVKSVNLPLSNTDANGTAVITRVGSPTQTQQLTLTNGGRVMSPETNARKERYDKERLKMTADITVLKTSIGELPQIKEPLGIDDGARPNTSSGALRDKTGGKPSSQSSKYRSRVRASAGGGGMSASQSNAMLSAASTQPQVAQMGFVNR